MSSPRRACMSVCCDVHTGEILQMTHVARGVDDDGTLTVDVVMRGRVPEVPQQVRVTVLPYTEQYIQTGPGLSVCLSLCPVVCVCVCGCVCLYASSGVDALRIWRLPETSLSRQTF